MPIYILINGYIETLHYKESQPLFNKYYYYLSFIYRYIYIRNIAFLFKNVLSSKNIEEEALHLLIVMSSRHSMFYHTRQYEAIGNFDC